jgi:hypothetical protein
MKHLTLQNISMISNDVDNLLKNVMLLLFLIWNVVEGSVFQNEYPYAFVKLYTIPIWRLLLVILMILAALWNHSLGIMVAFTMFFYVMDMEVTMDKWR